MKSRSYIAKTSLSMILQGIKSVLFKEGFETDVSGENYIIFSREIRIAIYGQQLLIQIVIIELPSGDTAIECLTGGGQFHDESRDIDEVINLNNLISGYLNNNSISFNKKEHL